MPIYENECTKCGGTEETFQKLTDEPLTTCKHCSGQLHKLISQSSFHLKGTGWYVTDYNGKKNTNTEVSKKNEDTSVSSNVKSEKSSDKDS